MKKLLTILVAFLFSYNLASAATLELTGLPTSAHKGDVFEVALMLDPENASINALSGNVRASGAFTIDQVREGGSFVPLWIEKPRIDNGVVLFSGLVPGGFSGVLGPYWTGKKPGQVLVLTVRAIAGNSGSLTASFDTLLSNDGEGTAISIKPTSFSLEITPGSGRTLTKTKDTDAPELFSVEVSEGWGDFAKQKVALFSTYDQQSGISQYAVKEGGRDFIIAPSPYVLKDGGSSRLIVRAYDNSGNYREATWDPALVPTPKSVFPVTVFWVILVISIACIVLLRKVFSRESR